MNLDELLALLPDNDTGDISAADLRTVVTELHRIATSISALFSYTWVDSDPTPGAGKITMDQKWSMSATKIMVNETTLSGEVLAFANIDDGAEITIVTPSGGRWRGSATGPSVDLGGYREIPVAPIEAVAPSAANNEKVSVVVDVMIE